MQRTTAVTVALFSGGMIFFAGLLLAAVGIALALGALVVLWLGAIVIARAADPDLVRPLVRTFPFLLVGAVVVWLVIIYGAAGG